MGLPFPIRAAVFGLLAFTACGDRLLDVENPDIIESGGLEGEAGATALFEGARAEFIVAHEGGGYGGLVFATGVLTDEFLFPGPMPEYIAIDRRDIQRVNGDITDQFLRMHRARMAAERAVAALQDVKDATSRTGEAMALGGYVYTLFGEAYCSGVPFSQTVKGVIEPGVPLSTQAMFEEGLRRLDQASAKTAGDPDVTNLVWVGRARVLLDLGRFADAAEAARQVPSDFRFENPHSAAGDATRNNLADMMWNWSSLGVADHEGTNGLDFVSAADPRVETVYAGISTADGQTPVYRLIALQSAAAPVLLASGIEARLIQAESALQNSDPGWLAYLNEARVQAGLAPLPDPGSATARVDLVFRERAFALYGTAHRLGDLRRLVRHYGRPAESVFPTGAYHKDNLVRGNQVSLPVPQTEENNPKYTPSACDPTKA